MATIYIKDVGRIKPGQESASPYSGTNIVNGGSEIPLKVKTIGYSRGISFDNKPSPTNLTEEPELNYVSRTAPIITLTGHITTKAELDDTSSTTYQISGGSTTSIKDQSNSTSTDEVDILGILDQLCVTSGYKEIYFKDGTAKNMLYGLGKTDTYNSTYRHLHIRCKSINITETPTSNLIIWNLTCEVTKGE